MTTATEAKHTPGPFVIRNDGDKYGDSMVFSEDGRELADFTGGLRDGVTFDEMHGNVRLFAAAPELLEACQAAVFAMGLQGANHDLNHPLRAAWDQCRAAIAKAEGR